MFRTARKTLRLHSFGITETLDASRAAASSGGLQFGGATGNSATTYTDTDEYTATVTAQTITDS